MTKINGWLNLHKPAGVSSARAVSIVKRYLKPNKIGHAGTLDPLASGVLPLALGEATKLVSYAMLSQKQYEFTVKWGEETDTLDREGKVVKTSDKVPDRYEIEKIITDFIGVIQQTPPAYSAIKIDGKRAYDLARAGKDVNCEPRDIEINDLQLIECNDNSAKFKVDCGKGTYVRSLARDIAYKLGAFCYVTELIRTKVGKFCINDTILLENIEKNLYKDALHDILIELDRVLDDIPVLEIAKEDADSLKHGRKINYNAGILPNDEVIITKFEGKIVALCEEESGLLKPKRVFNI